MGYRPQARFGHSFPSPDLGHTSYSQMWPLRDLNWMPSAHWTHSILDWPTFNVSQHNCQPIRSHSFLSLMKTHPVYAQPSSPLRTHEKPLGTITPHRSPESAPGRELAGCVVHLTCSPSLKEQSDITCFLMPETNFLLYIDMLYIVYGR